MSDTPTTWRVAFIGAGTIIQRGHIPAFQRMAPLARKGVETVAICDVNETRAQIVAAETNIPHVFTDYREMLEKVQPNVIVVATPNIFHKEMTLAALDAGAHVLCEKPLALTYADAKAVMDHAAQVGKVLTVGTHYRWSTPMRAAKAQVDGGFFGDIYAARTVWQRHAGIPGYGSWFTNKDLAGAGSILDIGVHALDRALFLMGYPNPTTVSGSLFANFGTRGLGLGGWGQDIYKPGSGARFDVDDMAWAFVRFDNGVTLQFQVAWASHLPEQFYTEIYGTQGAASVGNRDSVELYTLLNGQEAGIQLEVPNDALGSYPRLIENFVRHLDGEADAEIVTPHQALTSVRIIDGIIRSSEAGHEISVAEETPATA